jgi:hypothetical protein
MAPVLKTGMGKLIVGSNPTPSARSQAAKSLLTCAYAARRGRHRQILRLTRSHCIPLDLARRGKCATKFVQPQ